MIIIIIIMMIIWRYVNLKGRRYSRGDGKVNYGEGVKEQFVIVKRIRLNKGCVFVFVQGRILCCLYVCISAAIEVSEGIRDVREELLVLILILLSTMRKEDIDNCADIHFEKT